MMVLLLTSFRPTTIATLYIQYVVQQKLFFDKRMLLNVNVREQCDIIESQI